MTTFTTDDPFGDLDRDWAAFCRRHRRRGLLASWADKEPALAAASTLDGLIPPPGADRTEVSDAIARLYIGGDDAAGRVLLQLLVPGMIRTTAKWRSRFPTTGDAAREVIGRTYGYIGHLRELAPIAPINPAWYVTGSVRRDLVTDHNRERDRVVELDGWLEQCEDESIFGSGSAEQETITGQIGTFWVLDGAVQASVIPRHAIPPLWMVLHGYTLDEAAEQTRHSRASVIRYRDRLHAHLRRLLAADAA